ncbi:hypothetical protein [Rhodocaloribacter sp.]|jgi:hypothetical protein
MFDDRAFRTWPLIFAGALMFGALFGFAAVLADLLFDGVLHVTPHTAAFALLAFAGYVGVAAIIRRLGPPKP